MTADSLAPRQAGVGQVRYRRPEPDSQPSYLYPAYRATVRRPPSQPLILLPHTLSEVTGPVLGDGPISESDNDLTRQHAGEPIGQRIVLTGRVLEEDGRPMRNTLIEIARCTSGDSSA